MDTKVSTIKSEYVSMRDGVRIAISYWSDVDNSNSAALPAVLMVTRYWRAMAFSDSSNDLQVHLPFAKTLLSNGYRLVVADARGTGASLGSRQAEVDEDEVDDIGELIEWIANQPWCDGRVATSGTSYTAITTLYSLVNAPAALKAAVCRAPDFDMYRHLFAPGGVINHWFIKTWGQLTADQDANDVDAVFGGGYLPAPKSGSASVLGVLPVDEDHDGALLRQAVEDHQNNFNIAKAGPLTFIDNFLSEKNPPVYAPQYRKAIEANKCPLVIRCGWHDAATQLGALSMFATFSAPIHIILGPWNHIGSHRVDPFYKGSETGSQEILMEETNTATVKLIDRFIGCSIDRGGVTDRQEEKQNEKSQPQRKVDYFTLGENRWKSTREWPLPSTQMQRLYLGKGHQLTTALPEREQGCDHYQVDCSASTGRYNRWYAQAVNQPVLFPDRSDEDKKLLVYDLAPLQADMEITGHPVISIWVRSTVPDGHLFAYLESIDIDGRVRLLTEGQLRLLHRKVSSDSPPYAMFGPYHSLKEKDAMPLGNGEVAHITFDLLPISVLLKKGQRIRIALAGADSDTFEPIEGCEKASFTVERNSQYPSYIDIPVVG